MKSSRKRIVISLLMGLTLGALSLSSSGCLWLAIPSLAYQGYKYEKKSEQQDKSAKQRSSSPSSDHTTE